MTASTEFRAPYWFGVTERSALHSAITEHLESETNLHPVLECHLLDLLTELDVVAARDQVWPTADVVRRATGRSADNLPVRISEREAASVCSLKGIPNSVRTALHQERP